MILLQSLGKQNVVGPEGPMARVAVRVFGLGVEGLDHIFRRIDVHNELPRRVHAVRVDLLESVCVLGLSNL